MSSLSSILEIAKKSLNANQVGISVTSHNISNASAPGYSRQRLTMSASLPEKTMFGYLGTGVTPATVQRMREKFLDAQTQIATMDYGQAAKKEQMLKLAESYFQEPSSGGLNAMMTNFFNAFQNLSLHPEESASRNAVIQNATIMNDSFHRLSSGLTDLEREVYNEAVTKVDKINGFLKTIAGLDNTITSAVSQGLQPNDVKDQRDKLLTDLAQLVNIKATENEQGGTTIAIGGSTVVTNGNAVTLSITSTAGKIKILPNNSSTEVTITSGELGALTTLYDTTISGYREQLDSVAKTMIDRINEIHSAGYGIGNPPSTGVDFFTGTDAVSIELNPALLSNINLIAASKDGSPGNNEVALEISGVQNERLMYSNTSSVMQYYNSIVSRLGSEIQLLDTESTSKQLVLEQLQTQQNSVAGVSLDEEMTNLIQYQHGFDAAARVVNTVNEMFETLLNMR